MENQVVNRPQTESKFKLPTETVELPSKGLLYSEDNPLSSGKVEMKYMTAREEDILTNQNYIRQGVVIDKLLQSLIKSDINYNDLLIGDKNAIMVAARILAYGSNYEFNYDGEEKSVDLSSIESKPIREDLIVRGKNEFEFTLPHSKNHITFKLLTHGDEIHMEREIKGLKKINKNASNEVTVRLAHMITSVNGSYETKDVREFVNNYLLAKDAREFRNYYTQVSPDIDLEVEVEGLNDSQETINIPITVNFFWPDA
jgi:hypothetical protein